jgi:hypothetical protein
MIDVNNLEMCPNLDIHKSKILEYLHINTLISQNKEDI